MESTLACYPATIFIGRWNQMQSHFHFDRASVVALFSPLCCNSTLGMHFIRQHRCSTKNQCTRNEPWWVTTSIFATHDLARVTKNKQQAPTSAPTSRLDRATC